MRVFGIVAFSIIVFNFLLYIMTIIDVKFISVTDMLYSILSGSVVALFAALFALSKSIQSRKVLELVFLSLLGSAGAWLAGVLVRLPLSLNIYGSTAIAYDFILGFIGALAVAAHLLEEPA